jgi:hypothetical protein
MCIPHTGDNMTTRLEYAEQCILKQLEIDALRDKLKEMQAIIDRNTRVTQEGGIEGAYDPTFKTPNSVL